MEKEGFDGNLRDKGHFQVHGWGGEGGPNKKTSLHGGGSMQIWFVLRTVHRKEWLTCRVGKGPVQQNNNHSDKIQKYLWTASHEFKTFAGRKRKLAMLKRLIAYKESAKIILSQCYCSHFHLLKIFIISTVCQPFRAAYHMESQITFFFQKKNEIICQKNITNYIELTSLNYSHITELHLFGLEPGNLLAQPPLELMGNQSSKAL